MSNFCGAVKGLVDIQGQNGYDVNKLLDVVQKVEATKGGGAALFASQLAGLEEGGEERV